MIIKVTNNGGSEYNAYGYKFVVQEVWRAYRKAYLIHRDFDNGITAIIAEVAACKDVRSKIRREIAYYVGNQIMTSAELDNLLWDADHR